MSRLNVLIYENGEHVSARSPFLFLGPHKAPTEASQWSLACGT